MLDEVETYAPDDGYFIYSHRTEQFLDCYFFICDLGSWVEDIVVLDINHFGLESRLFCCSTDIEVYRRKNWLTPQLTAICCDEANKSVPVWCHCCRVSERMMNFKPVLRAGFRLYL